MAEKEKKRKINQPYTVWELFNSKINHVKDKNQSSHCQHCGKSVSMRKERITEHLRNCFAFNQFISR